MEFCLTDATRYGRPVAPPACRRYAGARTPATAITVAIIVGGIISDPPLKCFGNLTKAERIQLTEIKSTWSCQGDRRLIRPPERE